MRYNRRFLFIAVLVASMAGLQGITPEECEADYVLTRETLDQIKKTLQGNYAEYVGKEAVADMIETYALDPDNLKLGTKGLLTTLENLDKVLDLTMLAGEIAYVDSSTEAFQKIGAYAGMEFTKSIMSRFAGGPVTAAILGAIEVYDKSREELRHQDCLLEIDLAYYRFLDDEQLQPSNRNRVNNYLTNYCTGQGMSPDGLPRRAHRKQLQCFIDEALQGGNRIQVYFSDSPYNPVHMAAEAMAPSTVADRLNGDNALRSTVASMFRDFDIRKRIADEQKKLRKAMMDPEFQKFRETLSTLKKNPELVDWFCQAMREANPPMVEVPDVSNISLDEAKRRLAWVDLDYTLLSAGPAQSSLLVHRVKKQDPIEGERLARNGKVKLWVYSDILAGIRVPGVVGKTYQQAEQILNGVGLKAVGSATIPASNARAADTVARQDPAENSTIDRGGTVSLTMYGSFRTSEYVWERGPAVVNAGNAPRENRGTEERFKESYKRWRPEEELFQISWFSKDRQVVYCNINMTASFKAPPKTLYPGDVVQLQAQISGSGTVYHGGVGMIFHYTARGVSLQGEALVRSGFEGSNFPTRSISPSFEVPRGWKDGEFVIGAGLWNEPPCNVTWTYRARKVDPDSR